MRATAQQPDEAMAPRRHWQLSLRVFLIGVILVGTVTGLIGKSYIDYLKRTEPLTDARIYELLRSVNPASLEGWSVSEAGDQKVWSLDRIVYDDRNGDGKPDFKAIETYGSTNYYYWRDTNYDGKFDMEVAGGCFGMRSTPLVQKVAVPRVPSD